MDIVAVWFLVTCAALAAMSRDVFVPVILSLPLAIVAAGSAQLGANGVPPELVGTPWRAVALFMTGQLGFLLGCGIALARCAFAGSPFLAFGARPRG